MFWKVLYRQSGCYYSAYTLVVVGRKCLFLFGCNATVTLGWCWITCRLVISVFFCVRVCCGLPISHPSGQFVHSLFHFPVYTEFNCRGWADTSKSVRGLLLVCMMSFPYFSVILAAQLSPFPSLTVSPRENSLYFSPGERWHREPRLVQCISWAII